MEQKPNGPKFGATELPPRDEVAALEAAGGDADLARELVETLVRGLPNELAELRSHYLAKDWSAVATSAHRVRGATSYCGVPALDTCLQELEHRAMAGDAEAIKLALLQVERAADRLARSI